MTPLRLLFVVQRYGPDVRGGAEQAARAVAEHLADRGHHVEVLSTTAESYVDWSGELPAEEVIRGVRVHRLPVQPLRDPEAFGRVNHQLTLAEAPVAPDLERRWLDAQGPSVPALEGWLDERAGDFDVAVFFTYLYATTTAGLPVAARHTATALVPCAHDELPLALHAFDRVAHLADALLLLTAEEARLVDDRFRPRSPQHVVGLGTDLGARPGEDEIDRFRGRAGVGDGSYLLYVGRIDPSKGTSWLLERFIALSLQLDPDLHLVLLGQPVVPVPDHPRVHVVSDADDDERDAAMAGAVALVHPSPHESFAMVVTEAWAQRAPVLAFAGNDVLRGHIERSGGGLVFSDGATLGAAAQVLGEDRGLRDALGEAGHAHVTAEHGWDTVISRWERALRQTATSPRAAAPRGPATARPPIPEPTSSPAPAVDPGPVSTVRDDLPPEWFARPLALVLALLSGFCLVGVAAAMAGWFHPQVVIPGSLLVGVPLGWAAMRALPRWSSTRTSHLAAAAVLVLVGLFTAHNLVNHGQHIVADRDPGVYMTTAKHLSDEGNLLVRGPSGPFVDAAHLSDNGAGFSPERRDTTLEAQFPHLTASVLAAAGWVNEIGMFLATPVVGGLALACLYAFATLLAGPRWSVAATAVAGASMPVMIFSRDSYSEPLAMALLFGGLWVLALAERSRGTAPWLLAGLLVGATCMARVDGYLNLIALALGLALHARLWGGTDRRRSRLSLAACAAGAAATTLVGLWDTAFFTGGYFRQSLQPRLPAMLGAAALAAVVGFVAAPLLWRRARTDAVEREATVLLRAGLWAAAVAVLGFFAWGYWVRPDPDGLPRVALEGMRVLSYLPQAKTLSVQWLTWYLGPVGVAAGVLGLLAALVGLARPKRPSTAVVAGLAAVFATTLLYLWTPNVTPDHPWAMRRFAAVAIPGLAVGVAVLGRHLWALGMAAPTGGGRHLRVTAGLRARRVAASVAGIAVVAGSLASTVAITWPVQDVRAQVPMRDRIHEVCDLAGDDAAILVPIDGILSLMFSVPVGVWCQVPSAGGTARLEPDDVARLATEWDEEGRRLVVVSSSETPVMNTLLPTGMVEETTHTLPLYPEAVQPTIGVGPERVVPDGRLGKGPDGDIAFHVYRIDVGAARDYLREQRAGPCAPSRRLGRSC